MFYYQPVVVVVVVVVVVAGGGDVLKTRKRRIEAKLNAWCVLAQQTGGTSLPYSLRHPSRGAVVAFVVVVVAGGIN